MHEPNPYPSRLIMLLVITVLMVGCQATPAIPSQVSRESKIPASAPKVRPETDVHPPQMLVDGYEQPIPIPGAVNTAGAEDSPFVLPDGNSLYFFFTPDLHIPVEKQLLDGVTGIYVSQKTGEEWGSPVRILLQAPGKLAMDGCEFVQGDRMWFCSAREGFEGIHWFTAEFSGGRWQDWQLADFDPGYQVGELHFSRDGNRLYFHSNRPGGKGGLDLWMSIKVNGAWQEPVNLVAVNTADNEGWPATSPDEKELWFNRNYAVWRSVEIGGQWQPAEQIVSPLAGEPSLDEAGNLYFVHHFYKDDQPIEADIYVARRKR